MDRDFKLTCLLFWMFFINFDGFQISMQNLKSR